MNKAITDGLDLMPPAFAAGLQDWSREDGTPGSASYAGASNAALVASDQDFGPCLELQKTEGVQRLRFKGETPILPGMYLEVRARVKAMAGALPSVRIAGRPGRSNGSEVPGLVTVGPSVPLEAYGRIVTVSAIVGTGPRRGTALVWGQPVVYGHLGLDLVGPNGGVVRIESVEIRDVTAVYHRKMMDIVDVRDYGAVGDGITDDIEAFRDADQAATVSGATVLVPEGLYYLGLNFTANARFRFEGKIVMDRSRRLALTRNFDFPSYVDAFGDEEEALKRALQALFNFVNHESLDLRGRRITLSEPLDVAAAVANVTTFANRRAIRNGQLQAAPGPAWDTQTWTRTASYNRGTDNTLLTNVNNAGQIPVGALITGQGVGREVYVTATDAAAGTIRISQPLHGAGPNQSYTFTRFKYLLDFSGFQRVARFVIDDIEFLGAGTASGVMLPPDGIAWEIRDCWFTNMRDRGLTSCGEGCNGLQLDRNQWTASDSTENAVDRKTIAFNTNKNDIKIRNNRAVQFRHFGVIAGGGHLISGNHFFQGDNSSAGLRTAGLILTQKSPKTTLTGNYIDNCWIEIGNEHDAFPAPGPTTAPFGSVSIVGNIFTAGGVPDWFTYIRLAPIGTNHVIDGISIIGNSFKMIRGSVIDRVEGVDTSRGSFDHSETRNMVFTGNTYSDIRFGSHSPLLVEITQTGAQQNWNHEVGDRLPFGGRVLGVEGLTAIGTITRANGTPEFVMPAVEVNRAPGGRGIRLVWPVALRGTVQLRVRSDRPG